MPDELLSIVQTSTNLDDMISGYQQLLALSKQHRLISSWRLQACGDIQLQEGRPEAQDQPIDWPCPDPLTAITTRHLIDTTPELLNAYLDLELKAELLEGMPDTQYRNRLTAALQANGLIQAWNQHPTNFHIKLAAIQSRLEEAQAEIERLQNQETSFGKEIKRLSAELNTAKHQITQAEEEEAIRLLLQTQEEPVHHYSISKSHKLQQERYEKLLFRYEQLVSSVI